MQILPGTPGVDNQKQSESDLFTVQDLELQWMSMCNRMPQQYSGIAARMKNMNPTILEFPAVEVTVPNEIIKSEMDAIHAKLKECNIGHWCYGHFHQSWHASIEGVLFKMLDIMELYEIR